MTARVLVVDDERNMRRMLTALLEEESYEVHEASDGKAAVAACESFEPDVVLLDLVMEPGPDGLSVLEQVKARHPDMVVIMMSGKATLPDAVRATKLGAFQFLEKPLSPEGVLAVVKAGLDLSSARADARALRTQLPESAPIVGRSAAMQEVRNLIAQVASTTSRVLISGESGTGKELVARAIHEQSLRRDRPFVCVNCAAIPKELVESELFGHERGAFTGAHARRRGKFELAHTGTLFLDEVGDLPESAQAKLLRVLEGGTIEHVGGERERGVDVRVVAATNKDLEAEVARGTFRADLFYRLNVFPIRVPPLRERLEDVPALTTHLAAIAGAKCTRAPREFTQPALDRLKSHSWPGNVRELANVVERLTILGGDGPVPASEVDAWLCGSPAPAPHTPRADAGTRGLSHVLEAYEADLIRAAIAEAGGNVADAARRLKTDRANLYRRMRRLGIDRK